MAAYVHCSEAMLRFPGSGLVARVIALLVMALAGVSVSADDDTRRNVLFIVVDDLRPQGGLYGYDFARTPSIDALAANGVTFTNAFANVPVCGASRASVMTGLRPTRERFTDYTSRADIEAPQVPTLAQHFRNNGYSTHSIGKVHHFAADSRSSWSEKPWNPNEYAESNVNTSPRNYLSPENIARDLDPSSKRPLPFEELDVDDAAYLDGRIAEKALQVLGDIGSRDRPFFLAVGFLKPHLPFNAPKKYWDMYPPESISQPSNRFFPDGAPREAWHRSAELRHYSGVPDSPLPIPDDLARKLIRGYYASMSYSDAQLGALLDGMEKLGLMEDTVVVVWGDHGWSLGEHGLWNKHSPFDVATKTTLVVSAPGYAEGSQASGLVEFVDIYPTVSELAGIDIPPHVQGDSFTHLLSNPELPGKPAVFPRWKNADVIRTRDFSYTEWRDDEGKVIASMMYDLRTDPGETRNVVRDPAYKDDLHRLKSALATLLASAG